MKRRDLGASLVAESLRVIANRDAGLGEGQLKQLDAAQTAVAHGVSALCYRERGEKKKSLDELDAFLESTEAMGIPEGEAALVRAYVAIERGDHDGARGHLEVARDHPEVTAETRGAGDLQGPLPYQQFALTPARSRTAPRVSVDSFGLHV